MLRELHDPYAALLRRQQARLRALLTEILPNNKFWSNRFATAELALADVQSPDDLHKLDQGWFQRFLRLDCQFLGEMG